jgi:hypothetical protein
MADVGVLKAAHHVRYGIHLPDVGQELVAQALPFRGTGHQAGDVHELDGGRHHLLRLRDVGDAFEAFVGHRHDAHVGLDGTERVVLRLDAGVGQRIEQSGLADIGQSHDTAAKSHGAISRKQVSGYGWTAAPSMT